MTMLALLLFFWNQTSYFHKWRRALICISSIWSDMPFWKLAAYFTSMRISLNPMVFQQSSTRFCTLHHEMTTTMVEYSFLLSVSHYVVPIVDQFHTQNISSIIHRYQRCQLQTFYTTNHINKSFKLCMYSQILSKILSMFSMLFSRVVIETLTKDFKSRFKRLNIRLYLNALKIGIFTQ